MTDQPEELLATPRFRVVRHRQILPDGSMHVRESIQHPGAVAILPLLDDQRVCLIRNHRVAVSRTLIELPAGTLDAHEDPQQTAHRELVEETGYRAARMERLAEFYMSPGILNERMHLFLATGLTPGAAALEPGEQIETLLVRWEEAIQMVQRGEIQDAKTVAGLLFYDRQSRSG